MSIPPAPALKYTISVPHATSCNPNLYPGKHNLACPTKLPHLEQQVNGLGLGIVRHVVGHHLGHQVQQIRNGEAFLLADLQSRKRNLRMVTAGRVMGSVGIY